MTNADRLITVLKEEERALRERDFAAVDALAAEKEALAAGLGEGIGVAKAEEIKTQAAINTRLFEVLAAALQSAQERLRTIDRALGAVGYNPEGERLTCASQKPSRRV